jgi:hypothetical protein
MISSFTIIGVLATWTAAAHAGSAPKELYGKSIVFTWAENRSQRLLGQTNFRDVLVPLSHSVYISTTGRLFDRFVAGSQNAAHETIGTSATSVGGGPKQIQFSGRTMTLIATNKGGMARKTTIEFNDSFNTCQADVVFAKQAGSNVVVGGFTGQLEIRSSSITGVTCSVREGNVFAQ